MNLGRRAALLAGLPASVPGTTVNRFCASSLQTIRMAFRAIRAGEGDAFVAGGVESITQVDGYPKDGEAPPEALRRRRADRERLHPDGADCGERRRALGRRAGGHGRYAQRSQERAVASQGQASSSARSRLGTAWRRTTVLAPSRRSRSSPRSSPCSRPGGKVTAGNSCPLNDGAAAVVVTSDTRAKELGLKPRARIIASAVSGVEPEIMGVRPDRRRSQRARANRHDDRRRRRDGAERGVRRAGPPGLPRARHRPVRREAQPERRAIALGHPYRDDGRADHVHAAERPRDARRDDRPRDDVRGRRQGMAMLVERLH